MIWIFKIFKNFNNCQTNLPIRVMVVKYDTFSTTNDTMNHVAIIGIMCLNGRENWYVCGIEVLQIILYQFRKPVTMVTVPNEGLWFVEI